MEREARNPGFPWLAAGLILLPFLPSLSSFLFPSLALSGHDLFFTFGPKMEFGHYTVEFPFSPPYWHPQIYGGHPFAGNPQAMAFYPASYLFFWFGWSLPLASWVTAVHVLLSGWFMLLLARRLGAPETGARIGALAWALGGQSMGRVFAGHLSWTYALPWIPLLFLGIQGAVERRSWKNAAQAGWAGGMLALCGAPQAGAYAFLGAFFFALWILSAKAHREGAAALVPSLVPLSAGAVSAVLLALPQVLATLPFLSAAAPGGRFPLDYAASGSMAPSFLASLLFPAHFGLEAKVGGFSWEQGAYVGIGGLVLAFRGLFFRPRGYKTFFLLLLLFSTAFALGPAAPVFPLLYRLPLLGAFRTPGRMMLMAAFSLALLAALGYPRKGEPQKGRAQAFPPAVLGSAALLLFLFPSLAGGKTDATATLLRIFGLLLLGAWALFLLRLPSPWSRRGGRIALLLAGTDLVLLCAAPAVFPPSPPPAPGKTRAAIEKALDSLPRNGEEWGLYRVDHPDLGLLGLFPALNERFLCSTRGDYDPAVARDYRRYLDALDYLEKKGGPAFRHALDLLAVRYRFSETPSRDPDREKDRRIAPGVHFIERKGVPSRFRWVREAMVLPDPPSWWAAHFSSGNPPDPAETATFLRGHAPPPLERTGPGSVRPIYIAPGDIALSIRNSGPGYVVASVNDIPGWKAELDRRPAPVYKADLLFMAVPVERPGKHLLTLKYAPPSPMDPYAIWLLALNLAVWFMALTTMWEKRKSRAAPIAHQGR